MHERNLPRRYSTNRTHVDITRRKKPRRIPVDAGRDDRVERYVQKRIIAPRAKSVETILDDSLIKDYKQNKLRLYHLFSAVKFIARYLDYREAVS